MDINENLIKQWEPKIQRLLSFWFVPGMAKEDLAQELRIAIIKAAKAFKKDKLTIFHTYLHTTMINTIKTLISKHNKYKIKCDNCGKINSILAKICISCKHFFGDEFRNGEIANNIQRFPIKTDKNSKHHKAMQSNQIEFVPDITATYEQVELDVWLDSQNLEPKERKFISLRLYGLTMEEITEDLEESAYKIRQSLREKMS